MKESTFPIIVIVITTIAALFLFVSMDTSGFSVIDCTLEQDASQPDTYNFNYTLLVGRHFNLLDCQYILYSENNEEITRGSTELKEVNMGSFKLGDKISVTDGGTLNPSKVEIIIYNQVVIEENGVNKTSMEKAYSKTLDL